MKPPGATAGTPSPRARERIRVTLPPGSLPTGSPDPGALPQEAAAPLLILPLSPPAPSSEARLESAQGALQKTEADQPATSPESGPLPAFLTPEAPHAHAIEPTASPLLLQAAEVLAEDVSKVAPPLPSPSTEHSPEVSQTEAPPPQSLEQAGAGAPALLPQTSDAVLLSEANPALPTLAGPLTTPTAPALLPAESPSANPLSVLEQRPENASLPTPQNTPAPTLPDSLTPEGMRRIAVAGNPNCGKTSLFNALTGLRQKVGNYPGVTVEKKEGTFHGSHGEAMYLLDLPGCYSLQSRSPDEAIARDVLLGRQPDTPRPDAILAVVDATNLERNLYLVTQLIELGLPVVLGLNMTDLAENQGIRIDAEVLSRHLGVPVCPLVATRKGGLIALRQTLSRTPIPLPAVRVPLPPQVEAEAARLAALMPANGAQLSEAVLLLSLPSDQLPGVPELSEALRDAVCQAQARMEAGGLDPLSATVEARYAWINAVCAASLTKSDQASVRTSDRLDAVLTHRIWGWPAFLLAMALLFFSIFSLSKLPADWITDGISLFSKWLEPQLPEGDFRSLLLDGVLAGVSGVVVFLPQILILTFFLGLLEDTGYMARAAFLMDRLMSKVGLHGKSFIPMLSSFACAIPGIMATRTIEQHRDRLVTILVAPLMSCSARLPVYTLLIAVLLPDTDVWRKTGIMLSMYLLGIAAAFLMAGIFKKTLLKSETPALLMEMPPYRRPCLRSIALRMVERAGIFLKRAGTVILALSVLLWALTTYPKPNDPAASASEALAHSVAGRLGHALEPVIAPLGFDWKIGIGLIGSFAAREVFVSTMSIVYSVENNEEEEARTNSLTQIMREEKHADGSPVYTPLTCVALMVFYVLAMQCISTLAIVRRETNSWAWPALQLVYMSALAYVAALLVVQGGRLLGLH